MTTNKEKAFMNGNIRENIIIGQMGKSMKEIGKMENRMEKAYIPIQKG